jgi:hypothetical protein
MQAYSLIGLTLVSGVKSPIGARAVFGISRCGGETMSKIVFRGKTYNSEFEMPVDVYQAYQEEKRKEASADENSATSKPLTDIVDMSPEMKEIYERAVSHVEERPASSRPLEELPKTEDIYRQSAPEDMKHLPSDESVYRPSRPIIDPVPSTIEPDQGMGMRGLMWGVIVALIITGIAFVLSRLIL